MAQLTRTEFVTELTKRGWIRYNDGTCLELYLDWGLRDVIREARWDVLTQKVAVTATTDPTLDLSSLGTTGASQVKDVIITTDGYENNLVLMDDEDFHDDWLERDQADDSNKGTPEYYYVYDDQVWLMPFPDQAFAYDVYIQGKLLAFSGAGATSGLPIQFDEAILPAAEAYCFRRAHEITQMGVAQAEMRRVVLGLLVQEDQTDESGRVEPYR